MATEIVARLTEVEPLSADWHKIRRQGIGGSDASVILGLNPWRSPYDLWCEKVSEAEPEAEPDRWYQRWGRLLEEPLAQVFTEKTGLGTHRLPVVLRSVEHPFMQANLDFVVVTGETPLGPLEVKTTRFGNDWAVADDGTVTVPLHVLAQDMHYLAMEDRFDRVWNIVGIWGEEPRVAEVLRTTELIENLVACEAEFWDLVTRRIAPTLDGTESTRRALTKRWTPAKDKTVRLATEPTTFMLGHRRQLLEEIAERKGVVAEIEAELCAMLADAEAGTLDDDVAVTWKGVSRSSIDAKALRAAHPGIATEFTKTTTYRRFGVSKPWQPDKEGADDPE